MPTYPLNVPHIFSPRDIIQSPKINVDFNFIVQWLSSGTYSINLLDIWINSTQIISQTGAIVSTPSVSLANSSGTITYSQSPNYLKVTALSGYSLSLGSNATSEQIVLNTSGNLGIGTGATISAKAHIISTTEQLRLGYDASNYYSTTVASNGAVTFNAVGAGAGFTFADALTVSGMLSVTSTTEQLRVSYDGSNYYSTTVANNGAVTFNAVGAGAGFTFADALTVAGMLSVTSTTEQLRVSYDGSNYYSTTVANNGAVTFNAVGAGAGFTFADIINSSLLTGQVLSAKSGTVGSKSIRLGTSTNSDFFFGTEDGTGSTFSATAYAAVLYNSVNTPMQFYTNGTLRLSVGASGGLGLGTDTPDSAIHVVGTTTATSRIRVRGTSGSMGQVLIQTDGSVFYAEAVSGGGANFIQDGIGTFAQFGASGNFGVGTSGTISAKTHIISTTEQLRLGYNASNYASLTVNSSGVLTLAPSGTQVITTGNATITGALTISAQPKAYVFATGNIATSNNVNALITMTGEIYDSSGMHSVSSNTERIQILEDGTYRIQGRVTFLANSTGYRYAAINSDTTSELTYVQKTADPTYNTQIDLSVPPMQLTAGQYIYMSVIQTSGGSLDVVGHSTLGWKHTYLSVTKLF